MITSQIFYFEESSKIQKSIFFEDETFFLRIKKIIMCTNVYVKNYIYKKSCTWQENYI